MKAAAERQQPFSFGAQIQRAGIFGEMTPAV
jgi:hypothetical protein